MGKLTPAQKALDVSVFFDADAPSGEPLHQQVQDPETGDVYAPGLRVTHDGEVIFDRRD